MEHVPPRCFLEKPYPKKLATVPACQPCNGGFSRDEEYLLAVLAHIGTSRSLTQKVEHGGVVDRALLRRTPFAELIDRSLRVTPDGRVSLEPDLSRVHTVLRKVAFGIYVIRYGVIPRLAELQPVEAYPYNIEDRRGPVYASVLSERFRPKRWERTQPGIFEYIVVKHELDHRLQCIMNFHETLWGVVGLPLPRRSFVSPRTSPSSQLRLGL